MVHPPADTTTRFAMSLEVFSALRQSDCAAGKTVAGRLFHHLYRCASGCCVAGGHRPVRGMRAEVFGLVAIAVRARLGESTQGAVRASVRRLDAPMQCRHVEAQHSDQWPLNRAPAAGVGRFQRPMLFGVISRARTASLIRALVEPMPPRNAAASPAPRSVPRYPTRCRPVARR